MSTRRTLGTLSGLILLSAWLVAPLAAQAQSAGANELGAFGSLGCGENNCVEIWKVKCTSSKTKCLCADGVDTGPPTDVLVVTIVGVSPSALLGKGDIGSGPAFVLPMCVCRGGAPGPITALVTFSITTAGPTNYGSAMFCRDKNNLPVADPTATKVTNQ
jgi:hypothetical protein